MIMFENDDVLDGFPDEDGDDQTDAYVIDTTGSGIIDTIYFDTNGDGQADMVQHDGNLDGLPDVIGLDSTGNGAIDTVYLDTGGDGNFDLEINSEAHLAGTGYDLDGDGRISYSETPTDSTHIGSKPYYDDDYGIMPAQFDVNSGEDGIIGHPAEDIANWHMQTHGDTCAVVSQEFILENLTGTEFNEDDLMNIAVEQGWYTPGGGTTLDNVGKLLEYYGLNVQSGSGSMENLQTALANGDKVIVGIDSDEMWSNGAETIKSILYRECSIKKTGAIPG